MSTHRGHRHRVRIERSSPPERSEHSETPAPSGRRRVQRATAKRGVSRASGMIGGLALLVAAAGAATAGQALTAGSGTSPATHQRAGSYTASYSDQALGERDATEVTRSGSRPQLNRKGKGTESTQMAIMAAKERTKLLKENASLAEKYADKLLDDRWVLPISGGYRYSTAYGVTGYRWSGGWHTGVDLVAPYGTPVLAVTNATVVKVGWAGSYGQQVVLELPDGIEIWYNHLSAIDVVAGQNVTEGQAVGRLGDTGNAYGAHLHFEIYLPGRYSYGEAVDPDPIMVAHGAPLR